MLTEQQIKWAAQHDWFVEAYNGYILVRDASVVNGQYRSKLVYHYDWAKLREWAGY